MTEIDCQDLESASNRLEDAVRFDQIPHTAKLFTDFLYHFERVARFYPDYGRNAAPLAARAGQIAALPYEREGLADALTRINRRAESSDLTFENINLLRRSGSVAVVTGQQAGLFTGPLYTIFKALTTIKLARCLNDQGVKAVPVFWVASEDHDFEEVNHCKVVDTDGHIKQIRYESCGHSQDLPVGQVELCEGIDQKITEMLGSLPHSEFSDDIKTALRGTYRTKALFAEAFSSLMARIFKDYGVVLLDPLDEGLKRIAAPIYASALEKSSEIAQALTRRSAELIEAGYHAQVHVSEDMVPLFIMDEGRRVALTSRDNRFYVKGSDRSFSRQELVEMADKCSTCFSPNVTLRPVVQDFLLPTAAYIGGPAEIAYFAQVRAVYEILGRPLPCVLPRASMTIVEGRHQKTMKKYSLGLADFFDGLHNAISKVVEKSLDRETASIFAETESGLTTQLDRLEQALRRTDATLVASVKLAREKILHQVEHLRTRFVHSSARRDEAAYRQVERACTTLFPEKNMQERELNIYYFLARYGPKLIDQLYEATEIGFSNHKLVYIGATASQVVNAP
jgi:bacillithiol biosynthesis cysteine-adding enzyme BshC